MSHIVCVFFFPVCLFFFHLLLKTCHMFDHSRQRLLLLMTDMLAHVQHNFLLSTLKLRLFGVRTPMIVTLTQFCNFDYWIFYFLSGTALVDGQGSDCSELFGVSHSDLLDKMKASKPSYGAAAKMVHERTLKKIGKHSKEKQLRAQKKDPFPIGNVKTGNIFKSELPKLAASGRLTSATVIDLCGIAVSKFDFNVKRLSETEFQKLTVSKTLASTLQSCRLVVVDSLADICHGSSKGRLP